MTNPVQPTGIPPRAPGGMPKWLIIVGALLLVVMLGCCGIFTLCTFLAKRAGAAAEAASGGAAARIDAIMKEAQADAVRQAAEAQRQGAAGGGVAPTGVEGNVAGGGGDGNGNEAIVGGPARGNGAAGGGAANGGTDATPKAMRMPTNFPKDVPVYAGMTPTFQTSDNKEGSGSVLFQGKVDRDTLVSYYTKHLKDSGWTETQNAEFGDGAVLVYTKDDRQVSVTISPDTGQTSAVVAYGKK